MTDTTPAAEPPVQFVAMDPRHLTELSARIESLEAWRAHQTDLLDDLLNNHPPDERVVLDTDADLDDDDPAHTDDGDAGLDSDALLDWVHRHVTPVIARPLRGELRWCPRWWEHSEAVFRFEALRRAWTELAPEPGIAMSVWIRDHLDPSLRELLSPLGPFADCSHNERFRTLTEHLPLPTLPTTTPDPG